VTVSVWSCGGGTQSAAIAALIVRGDIEAPDYAVIADTEREKSGTWRYMDAVLAPTLAEVGVELRRVHASEFATVDLWGGRDRATLLIPAFTSINGSAGKMANFCSYEWKRRVVERFMRSLGVTSYESWIGFSADEAGRVAKAISPTRPQRYPLIERSITRNQCYALLAKMGWPTPPRSSCWMCPNQSPREWESVRYSEDWQKVVAFDAAIRETDPDVWLTNDMKPIGQVEFKDKTADMFECESGECFV